MNLNIIDAADIVREDPDENDENGEEEDEEEEEEEQVVKRRRGKDRSWNHIASFPNMEQFKETEIYASLKTEMKRNNRHETEDYHLEIFVCRFFRKAGWKLCPRTIRVGYSTTSQDIVVWETDDNEHQHEEDPNFDTGINYHWTAGFTYLFVICYSFIFVIDQEEVVRRHMEAKVKRNILILRELRAKNLVNGAGKLPTQAQVS